MNFINGFLITVLLPFRKSLRVKLTAASIIVMLLTVAVITVFGYISVYTILKDNMSRYLEDSMKKANESMDLIIRDADRINTIVALNESKGISILQKRAYSPSYEWFNDIKGINSFLTSLVNTKEKVFAGISVFGVNGQIYKGGTPQVRENTFGEEWFKKVVEANGRSIVLKRSMGEYGISDDNNYILSVCSAIMNYGETKGVVVTDIDFNVLNDIYRLKGISKGGLYILDGDNKIVFKSSELNALKNMNDEVLEELLQKLANDQNDEETVLMGEEHFTIASKSEYSNWSTVVIVPKDYLLKDFFMFSNRMVLIVIVIVAVVLMILSVVIGRITKNINELTRTMEDVRSGNINARPKIRSIDEIGELSGIFIGMMEKVQNLMEGIKSKEREKREAELQALQSQINPHFLCNTLNTIKYLANLQNIKNISELTTSLVRLLRITIDNTERYITIEEELDHVKSYLTIQRYKYSDGLSAVFSVEEEVLKFKTIKMILQPLVENAIIHGIEPSGREGLITIKVYRECENIKFKVTDNGIGMTPEQIQELMDNRSRREKSRFSGIGVSNVNERIQMFFGEGYGVKIYSQPGMCTTVEVDIPIID